jgi:hypothetical protein
MLSFTFHRFFPYGKVTSFAYKALTAISLVPSFWQGRGSLKINKLSIKATFWRFSLLTFFTVHAGVKLQRFNLLGAYAQQVCLRGGKYVRDRRGRVLLRVVPQDNVEFPKF